MTAYVYPTRHSATVLLDTLSLYHAVRRDYGGKLDYGCLLAHVADRFTIERSIAYVLANRQQEPFVKMLEARGVDEIVLCTEYEIGSLLAVDALTDRNEVLVIATADPQFCPLFSALKDDVCVVYTPTPGLVPNGVECVCLSDRFLI